MRIITLGTGAGRPSIHRNSSATALEYDGDVLLFDCGEAAQLQLMRTPIRWSKLSAIFIGHLHGDHVNGLPGLLGTMSMCERETPLKLYGPPGLKKYLEVLQACKTLWVNFPLTVTEIREAGPILETPRYSVASAPLNHVVECWGFRFQEKDRPGHLILEKVKQLGIPDGPERARLVHGERVVLADGRTVDPEECVGPKIPGRSVAYCCDTQPCESELGLAEGVDLLIHEATFDPSLKAEANEWGHSTNADAAEIAGRCGAKRLLLTHVSQRYTDGAVFLNQAREIFAETLLAEDLGSHDLALAEAGR